MLVEGLAHHLISSDCSLKQNTYFREGGTPYILFLDIYILYIKPGQSVWLLSEEAAKDDHPNPVFLLWQGHWE